MDWFLYDIGLRHERVKSITNPLHISNTILNLKQVHLMELKYPTELPLKLGIYRLTRT